VKEGLERRQAALIARHELHVVLIAQHQLTALAVFGDRDLRGCGLSTNTALSHDELLFVREGIASQAGNGWVEISVPLLIPMSPCLRAGLALHSKRGNPVDGTSIDPLFP
jgi:hypothetical protein